MPFRCHKHKTNGLGTIFLAQSFFSCLRDSGNVSPPSSVIECCCEVRGLIKPTLFLSALAGDLIFLPKSYLFSEFFKEYTFGSIILHNCFSGKYCTGLISKLKFSFILGKLSTFIILKYSVSFVLFP